MMARRWTGPFSGPDQFISDPTASPGPVDPKSILHRSHMLNRMGPTGVTPLVRVFDPGLTWHRLADPGRASVLSHIIGQEGSRHF